MRSHSYWPPSLERRKAFLRIINAVEDAGSLNLINRTLVHTIDCVRAYTKYVCRRNFTWMRYTSKNLICVFAELKLIGRSRIYSITSFFGRIKFSETRALHLDIQYRRFSTLFFIFHITPDKNFMGIFRYRIVWTSVIVIRYKLRK